MDRALGRRLVAELRAAGLTVEAHDDHFAQDTEDVDLFPAVGARGWVFLTKDKAIKKRDNELTEGIAAAVALAQPILEPGQHFGLTAAWGGFDDANAIGVSAAGVLARNLLRPGSGTLALFGGVGAGMSEGTVAGRAGVSFGW